MSGEDKAETSKQVCPYPFLGLRGTCRWWNFTAMVPLLPSAHQPPPKGFYKERPAALFQVQSTAARLHSHVFLSPSAEGQTHPTLLQVSLKGPLPQSAKMSCSLLRCLLGLPAQPCTLIQECLGFSSHSSWQQHLRWKYPSLPCRFSQVFMPPTWFLFSSSYLKHQKNDPQPRTLQNGPHSSHEITFNQKCKFLLIFFEWTMALFRGEGGNNTNKVVSFLKEQYSVLYYNLVFKWAPKSSLQNYMRTSQSSRIGFSRVNRSFSVSECLLNLGS